NVTLLAVTEPMFVIVIAAETVVELVRVKVEVASKRTWPHGVVQVRTSCVSVILQPPEKLPRSPAASSTTYRLHVPFGLPPAAPVKAEVSVSVPTGAGFRYGPAGAGAANVSPAPTLLGLYVPLASGPASGNKLAAESSRVMLT